MLASHLASCFALTYNVLAAFVKSTWARKCIILWRLKADCEKMFASQLDVSVRPKSRGSTNNPLFSFALILCNANDSYVAIQQITCHLLLDVWRRHVSSWKRAFLYLFILTDSQGVLSFGAATFFLFFDMSMFFGCAPVARNTSIVVSDVSV